MLTLPSTSYLFFRLVIPGQYAAWLLYFYLLIYFKYLISGVISEVDLSIIVLAAGVFLGVMIHYFVAYPKKSKRFRAIERERGPIHYLLEKCKNCDVLCRREKMYDTVSVSYFRLLNEDVNEQTRERIYYFFSLYYMSINVALISACAGVLFSFTEVLHRICLRGERLLPLMISAVLAVIAWIGSRPNSPIEKYVIQMFQVQKEWLEQNPMAVEKKFCRPHQITLSSGRKQ